ncbi:MAG: T9SS type A sorting domain-containing protein [Paludibacter sp.]
MKRNLILSLLFLAVHFLNANPLPVPNDFVISELFFNSEGKWTIELKFVKTSFFGTNGIYVTSVSGQSKLKQLTDDAIFNTKILTITNDSLQSDLTINPLGDSLFFFRESAYPIVAPLIFGNRVNASVRAPRINESISLYGYEYENENDFDYTYSIDKSPSIGYENDSTGMCGTIKGKIYDPYNLLPANVCLTGNGITDFKLEANGNYSARITSSKHTIDKLYYFGTNYEMSSGYYVKVSPVVVTTEPDTIVNVDFHIYDIVYSIESIKNDQNIIFKIAPNLIKESSFNYEIAIPVKSSNSYIELFNMSGQLIERCNIIESKGTINLKRKLQAGNYTVRLLVNNKNYANSKIIVAN